MVPREDNKTKILRPPKIIIKSSTCKPLIHINDDYVHQKYVIEGLNMSQIARELFTSRQTIRARLLKMGVKLRSSIDQMQNQKHTKYGYRKIKGETIRHKTESRTATVIYEMRGKGLSFQAIADILSEMKIPTKQKGKKWTKGMVRNIFMKNSKNKQDMT